MKTGNAVFDGLYKDVPAVVLENEYLRVKIVPGFGAKTASMFYKQGQASSGHELLWQASAAKFKKTAYGDPYSDGEISGFDEMFPSISQCFYEDKPWAGAGIPDHGEVWSIPWSASKDTGSAVFSVDGVRFPYTLTKTVRLEGSILRSVYRLENRSSFAFPYIWAAHPLFNAAPGMRFVVPNDCKEIVNAVAGPVLGGYGEVHTFPIMNAVGGKVDLSTVSPPDPSAYQKYYFRNKLAEGWCALENPVNGLSIRMSFPSDKISYLGMWLNQGGWAGQYNIAPEPCSAGMDRIDAAKLWGMQNSIAAGSMVEWYLDIAVSQLGK